MTPIEHLAAFGKKFPDAWRRYDEFRAARGKDLPDWPAWCWCPMAAAYGVVSGGRDIPAWDSERIDDVGRIAALAAWRTTKGIYRFDRTLYDDLLRTPVEGDIPCEVLRRLPEWCVYLETPGLTWGALPIRGCFAHLEWDPAAGGREELRLVFDHGDILVPIPLHIGPWSLDASIQMMLAAARKNASAAGVIIPVPDKAAEANRRRELEPIVSLVLYICSEASDLSPDGRRPVRPRPVQTKRGPRYFPADKPAIWEVGVRIGAALRRAYSEQAHGAGQGGPHARPRAHIRRAHWHTYRTGPRKRDGIEIPLAERGALLRWLPPIPVNMDALESLPATIHKVCKET